MGRRIRWMGLVLIVCFALVILQLVNVQFRQASALKASPYNPRISSSSLDNPRGLILAATGTVIARSTPSKGVAASTYSFHYYRTYPTGTLFSGVVGYASAYRGTSGIENVYNTQLTPHTQPIHSIGQLLTPPPPSSDDVTLTVEKPLQLAAKQALAAIPNANQDGAVVVVQPRTGAVLADYSSPSFDPNTLSQPDYAKQKAASQVIFKTKDHETFVPGQPMATWYAFQPGSTFKVVTSAAVYDLEPSLITFNYPVQGCTTPDAIPTTNKQICNDATTATKATPCGGTMVQMLPESCDPGYATLGLELGPTKLYDQAQAFGWNSVPPIDLNAPANGEPGIVSKSRFPTPADFGPGGSPGPAGVAYAAFGQQTVNATALQNAMVAEGIADTGVVMTPHLMASIRTHAQAKRVTTYKPTTYKTATTQSAAKAVSSLMQGVVTHGTATGVGFPPQDNVAAKTGTAQVGTAQQRTVDWMIGFAPATNPTVAVAVVVPDQPTTKYGATTAGPIMRTMIEATLALQAQQAKRTPSTTTTTTAPTTTTTTPTTTTIPHATTTAPPTTTTTVPPTTTTTTTTVPPTTTTTTVPPTTSTTTGGTPPGAAAGGGGATATGATG